MRNLLFGRISFGIYLLTLTNLAVYCQASDSPVVAGVPDAGLRQCISQLMMKHQWQMPAEVVSIKCHNRGIVSTKGIEQFKNIELLSLYKNAIESIDLSEFKKLKTINLASNKMRQLTISHLPKLASLYIFKNQLTVLSLEGLPALVQVKANDNKLNLLQLLSTPQLAKLYLFNNQLEFFEIKNLPELRYLDVRQNPMPDDFYDFLDEQNNLTARHDGNAEDWD